MKKAPRTGPCWSVVALGYASAYAGAAFIALADEARTEFLTELARLTTSWAAFKSSRLNDARWCQPKLTVGVKHLAGSKMLRHATVKGLAGTHV